MDKKVSVHTLKNGLQVIIAPMPGIKSLTTLAMVGVGSRFEQPKLAGISHFLEHLPFKGTKNYPTSMEVAAAVDGVGGKHNAFTSKDYTGYWVKVGSRHWQVAFDVVSDLLLQPLLRPEDIAMERGVILEEINMYEDQPQAKVSDVFDDLVFAGSPLSRPVIGTKETVSALEHADFVAHRSRWYNPKNVVVALVGGGELFEGSEKELLAKVEEYFSKGEVVEGGGEREYGVNEQDGPRTKVFFKETEQAHFYLGYPGMSRTDERRYVMSVLVTLLGGNSSSRLFNEIREKRGLAYYAYASADLYHEAGAVYALEGVNLSKIEDAIKVTLEEFSRAAEGGSITDGEVERAIEYVTGKMALDLEDSASMANFLTRRQLLEGKILSIEEVFAKVRAVTREEVVKLAGELFDVQKRNLAIVGPFKDEDKFAKLLG